MVIIGISVCFCLKALKTLHEEGDVGCLCPETLRIIQNLMPLIYVCLFCSTFSNTLSKNPMLYPLLKSSRLADRRPMCVCFFPNKNESRRCLFGLPLPKIIPNCCRHAYGFLSAFSPHLKISTSTLSTLLQNSGLHLHVVGMNSCIWIISLLQSALLKHIRDVYVACESLLHFAQNTNFRSHVFLSAFLGSYQK